MQTQTATAQWVLEPTHCKIGFSVRHFGISEVEGQFRKYEGTVSNFSETLDKLSIQLSVATASIDTDEAQRDAHLRSADFFDSDHFPSMDFVSTGITHLQAENYQLTGNLSLRGVTKPVTLAVVYGGIIPKDPFGNTKAGFKVTGSIDRRDFGLTWNTLLELGGVAVGHTVNIICHIQLLKTA